MPHGKRELLWRNKAFRKIAQRQSKRLKSLSSLGYCLFQCWKLQRCSNQLLKKLSNWSRNLKRFYQSRREVVQRKHVHWSYAILSQMADSLAKEWEGHKLSKGLFYSRKPAGKGYVDLSKLRRSLVVSRRCGTILGTVVLLNWWYLEIPTILGSFDFAISWWLSAESVSSNSLPQVRKALRCKKALSEMSKHPIFWFYCSFLLSNRVHEA